MSSAFCHSCSRSINPNNNICPLCSSDFIELTPPNPFAQLLQRLLTSQGVQPHPTPTTPTTTLAKYYPFPLTTSTHYHTAFSQTRSIILNQMITLIILTNKVPPPLPSRFPSPQLDLAPDQSVPLLILPLPPPSQTPTQTMNKLSSYRVLL